MLTDEILRRLAELADVPTAQRKSFFDSIRANVRRAWELDGIANGGLANKKGATLHNAALALYDKLGTLSDRERMLIEGVLNNNKIAFDRISSGGVPGLRQTTYELAGLFSLVTSKTPPRRPDESTQSRKGGRGTTKHPRYQKFICNFLISTTAVGGKLDNNPYGGTSSMRDALNMLVPHLPKGFDPRSLSLATFQRLKTLYARQRRKRRGNQT